MKSHDYIYKKILRDVNKYISKTRNDKKLFYTNDEGEPVKFFTDFSKYFLTILLFQMLHILHI